MRVQLRARATGDAVAPRQGAVHVTCDPTTRPASERAPGGAQGLTRAMAEGMGQGMLAFDAEG